MTSAYAELWQTSLHQLPAPSFVPMAPDCYRVGTSAGTQQFDYLRDMAILPGFEYDIFISYRHNDNLDGWVSDFVQNLEKGLRATIKDPVSVYFPARPAGGDTNPHDGLPETDNVDKRLKANSSASLLL